MTAPGQARIGSHDTNRRLTFPQRLQILIIQRHKLDLLGQALLAVLGQASWLRGLDAAMLQKATAGYGKTVQGRAAELLAKAKAPPANQAKLLRELADGLPGGDALRGKAVFRSPKAGCVTCQRSR